LATLLAGSLCALFLRHARGTVARLMLLWLAYCGVIMALAQVVIGAINPQADVGRAMIYLQVPGGMRRLAAGLVLLLIPAFALWLSRGIPRSSAQLDDSPPGARHVFAVATLPALLALPIIVLFRVPREFAEVAIVPALFVIAGIPWMQAGAAFMKPHAHSPREPTLPSRALPWLWAATVALLAVFQLVLRPGIRF
jgi:hypothetical protein